MSAAGAWSMHKGASQLHSSGRGGSAYYRIPRRHGAAFPLESELLREGLPQLEHRPAKGRILTYEYQKMADKGSQKWRGQSLRPEAEPERVLSIVPYDHPSYKPHYGFGVEEIERLVRNKTGFSTKIGSSIVVANSPIRSW